MDAQDLSRNQALEESRPLSPHESCRGARPLMHDNFTISSEPFSVRRFEVRDREAVLALWPADVMHSLPGTETTEMLIDSVEGAIAGKDHVWVAEAFGRIIGSAAVIHSDFSLAHLSYLCVVPDFAERQAVARGLAEMAIRDAYERGYLKLVVHSTLPPSRLATALHDLGFEFSREREAEGEHVLEFYQNLYERPRTFRSEAALPGVIRTHGSQAGQAAAHRNGDCDGAARASEGGGEICGGDQDVFQK
jgi:hypothetical protein